MSRIKSIIKKKVTGSLHNIAVKGDESYVANGIIVHNCRSVLVAILIGDKDDPDSFFSNYPENRENFGTNISDKAVNPEIGFGGSGNK